MRSANAYTYAFRITGTRQSTFKIGWTSDIQARLATFNKYSLPELDGLKYLTELHELWDTNQQAYEMEQGILKRFSDKKSEENSEVIFGVSKAELETVWQDELLRVRGKPRQ